MPIYASYGASSDGSGAGNGCGSSVANSSVVHAAPEAADELWSTSWNEDVVEPNGRGNSGGAGNERWQSKGPLSERSSTRAREWDGPAA